MVDPTISRVAVLHEELAACGNKTHPGSWRWRSTDKIRKIRPNRCVGVVDMQVIDGTCVLLKRF